MSDYYAPRARPTQYTSNKYGTWTHMIPYYDKSWAVIIGINNYVGKISRLANARNDAEAFAKLLIEKLGFEKENVITLLDKQATKDAIMDQLEDQLPKKVGPNDRLIFFFAGHGKDRKNPQGIPVGYIIPQDAQKDNWRTYIHMESLHHACKMINAKHIFIILDCCFSGILAITLRSESNAIPKIDDAYLKKITTLRAWQVLTAGESDQEVADSGLLPGHSAFTAALLDGLEGAADIKEDHLITANRLSIYVRERVSKETSQLGTGCQYPYYGSFLPTQGDFVFLLPYAGISGKSKKNERTKKIQNLLYDLSTRDLISLTIVSKALMIIASNPKDHSKEDLLYDRLLDQLIEGQFEVNQFIEAWNKITLKQQPVSTISKPPSKPNEIIITPAMSSSTPNLVLQYYSAWLSKGDDFYRLGKYGEALQAYNKAIELYSKDAKAWVRKGDAIYHHGSNIDAIQAYNIAIELDPSWAVPWKNKGYALYELGKYDEAIKAYYKATELDPKDTEARYFMNHSKSQSVKDETTKRDASSWFSMGIALENGGKYDEAIKCFDKAIALNPGYINALREKGDALRHVDKYEEAIACLDNVLIGSPSDTKAWFSKGIALYEQGKYDEAVQAYDNVLKIIPEDIHAWNAKGIALKSLGRIPAANIAFAKARELGYKGKSKLP